MVSDERTATVFGYMETAGFFETSVPVYLTSHK
jgi:hypothetical protein